MPKALLHRNQHIGIAACLDKDHPVRMKAGEMQRRCKEVTPMHDPEYGSFRPRQDPADEDRRGCVIGKIATARNLVESPSGEAAVGQALVDGINAEWQNGVAGGYALDLHDSRSQVIKDGGIGHGTGETQGSLCSSYVLTPDTIESMANGAESDKTFPALRYLYRRPHSDLKICWESNRRFIRFMSFVSGSIIPLVPRVSK